MAVKDSQISIETIQSNPTTQISISQTSLEVIVFAYPNVFDTQMSIEVIMKARRKEGPSLRVLQM